MQEQDAQVRPEHGAVDRPAAQDALRTDLPAGRSTLSRASGRSPGARERWKKSNEDLRVEARKGDEEGRGITGDATPPQGGVWTAGWSALSEMGAKHSGVDCGEGDPSEVTGRRGWTHAASVSASPWEPRGRGRKAFEDTM